MSLEKRMSERMVEWGFPGSRFLLSLSRYGICRDSESLSQLKESAAIVVPEFIDCIGFEQNNFHHDSDVALHIARSVSVMDSIPYTVICESFEPLMFAIALHDIAKPESYTEKDGVGHFYGHAERSADKAAMIAARIGLKEKDVDLLYKLVRNHDIDITAASRHSKDNPDRVHRIAEDIVKTLIRKKGYSSQEVMYEALMLGCDTLAQNHETISEKIDITNSVMDIIEEKMREEGYYCIPPSVRFTMDGPVTLDEFRRMGAYEQEPVVSSSDDDAR